MTVSSVYEENKIWLTLDVEELLDSNFNLLPRPDFSDVDYEKMIDNWIEFCAKLKMKSTCFVLGSFAQKYPKIIKKLSDADFEIASHGFDHRLVYKISLDEWEQSIVKAKTILEDLTGREIGGYRAASWSMPFENSYYEILAKNGYSFSSSYMPFKTYMYGQSEDKKLPFEVETKFGNITEIPLPKCGVPFSGGFYLRVLPLLLQKVLFKKLENERVKPVIYIHPYELNQKNLMRFYLNKIHLNLDFFLAFYSIKNPLKKISYLCRQS
jgi:polysaccharide deacetylase family protein (PEP-CTERM system associated)